MRVGFPKTRKASLAIGVPFLLMAPVLVYLGLPTMQAESRQYPSWLPDEAIRNGLMTVGLLLFVAGFVLILVGLSKK